MNLPRRSAGQDGREGVQHRREVVVGEWGVELVVVTYPNGVEVGVLAAGDVVRRMVTNHPPKQPPTPSSLPECARSRASCSTDKTSTKSSDPGTRPRMVT